MPRYDYRCPSCGVVELVRGLEERETRCICGQQAERLPFSGLPHISGETVAKAIPDPHYRQEAEKRELHATWGDASRSMEMLRKAVREDGNGGKFVDTRSMT